MTAGIASASLQSTPKSPRVLGMSERGPGPAGGTSPARSDQCRLIGGSGSHTLVTGTSGGANTVISALPFVIAVTRTVTGWPVAGSMIVVASPILRGMYSASLHAVLEGGKIANGVRIGQWLCQAYAPRLQ